MKKIMDMKWAMAAVAAMVMSAMLVCCGGEEGEDPGPEPVAPSEFSGINDLETTAKGGVFEVNFTASSAWTATVRYPEGEAENDWLTILPASGEAGSSTIDVEVAPNNMAFSRSASVVLASGETSQAFAVTQSGSDAFDVKRVETTEYNDLALRFTATWCPHCPEMAQAIDVALGKGKKFAVVNLHGYGSDLYAEEVEPIMEMYGITGFPTMVMDSRIMVGNYAKVETTVAKIEDALINIKEARLPSFSMMSEACIADGKINAKVSFLNLGGAEYKCCVWLLEDGIEANQTMPNGSTQRGYKHNDVFRMALSAPAGDAFTLKETAQEVSRTYSCPLPDGCEPTNLKLVTLLLRSKPQNAKYAEFPFYMANSLVMPL